MPGRIVFKTTPDGQQAPVESMRIDNAGNVGIGTSSPLGKLKVAVGDVAPAASGDMNTGVIFESASGSRAINIGVNNTAGFSWINAAFANNSGVADPLVFMTGATERMRINADGGLRTQVTGGASIMETFGCRAWVNFDGTTTTPTIRASGNVSSVTRIGTGHYQMNFTTAMPDANYALAGACETGSSFTNSIVLRNGTLTTSSVQFVSSNGNTNNNQGIVCVSIFR
jgi:hypothetical protein